MLNWPSRTVGAVGAGAAIVASVTALFTADVAAQETARFGFGRVATPQEIAGWDIDVRPDGHGLRKGRGTVEQGQAIYDAQCASCHGTFGESTKFMVLAGGVKKEDLGSGRASGLLIPDVQRTLGNKLNHATTLWDYIYRAMPWTNPQSLSVDETYAVTAYVLHLNDIVAAEFELNERNILTLRMPNRYGMTTHHGLMSPKAKPDVQGSLCMKDCIKEVKIESALPEFARNAHGNLREQVRDIGPYAGIDTTRYEAAPGRATQAASTAPSPSASADLVKASGCMACHALDNRVVGPGFREIGGKYANRSDAEAFLASRIKSGGVGTWGQIPMPPQSAVKDDDARAMAKWILAGAR